MLYLDLIHYRTNWLRVRRMLVTSAFFSLCILCACASNKKAREQPTQSFPLSTAQHFPTSDQHQTDEENHLLIMEFKRLYESAQSWQEKRDICIKAIDKGLIYRAGPVSVLDAIFNTKLSAPVAGKQYGVRWSRIHFGLKPRGSDQPRRKHQDGNNALPEWALLVEHDRDVILTYRITIVEK